MVIKSLTAVFSCAYYCAYCAQPYSTRLQHKICPFKCDRCFHSPPCERASDIKCFDCNRTFVNSICFNRHKREHICLKVRLCVKCLAPHAYSKENPHVCGVKYCFMCKEDKPVRHDCFIPKAKSKEHKAMSEIFVFFDLECTQSNPFPNDSIKFEHIPNLCVAQQACDACCALIDVKKPCINCGVREHIFMRHNVIEKFMTYLSRLPKKFKKVIVIAHNLQKYDGHFILQYMYKHASDWCFKNESLIINGSKILQIKMGRYKFLDSLNFFSVALAKLPEMFSLPCKSKGYYPHFFNTPSNFKYKGPLPAESFYGINNMKESDRNRFLKWYDDEKKKNEIFDNKSELIKYCKQDVNILRLACLKFQSLLIELTTVDPFDQITIAGTCMAIFKSNFIKSNQIAIIPTNGYRLRDNQSMKALKWLEWIAHTQNIKIRSAANGREVRLTNNIVVDGYHENTIYEFMGCYWHQCLKCYPIKYHNELNNNYKMKPVRALYEAHLLRTKKIKSMGFKLVQIWEHEFDELYRTNEQLRSFLRTLDYLKKEPLNPRDAFFGGRTGVCKLYHKTVGDEKILYYDVTSLYPYINKYSEYPTGVPKILLGKELKDRTVFNINGLIKCLILPPKALYHPVLPLKMHSKLLFALCYKCAEEKNIENCKHNDKERAFIATYVAEELRVAVEKGYTILKIFEAWEYHTTKYNPATKSGGIFAEYIDTFLKLKTQASGYPSWCKTNDDKDQFIQSFYEKEGISLEKGSIIKNPGLRSLSKICLNSIWGKFGERPDKMKKVFISERDKLLNLMTNPAYETHSLYTLSPDAVLASYKLINECNTKQPNVNVVIAAYTTAHARLHLYKYLDLLQDRVLYYDTDSVFFVKSDRDIGLPLGDYLGDLTDELAGYGENCYIDEVVFTSEKSYAFTVKSPGNSKLSVCKVKGISLNHDNAQHINFETMKTMVLKNTNDVQPNNVKLNTNTILRLGDSTVYSTCKEYTFKVNATKRRRVGCNSIETLPYGYDSLSGVGRCTEKKMKI